MNCRSIVNKGLDLEHLVAIHEPDVIALTETWLHSGVYDNEFTPQIFMLIVVTATLVVGELPFSSRKI